MAEHSTATAPALPEAKMNLLTPKNPGVARIVSSKLCMKGKSNSFVRHVCFDVSGTPLEGNWVAGQSFGVIPPGTDENGKPHKVRLYSIACPSFGEDGEGKIVSTTPKRVIDERSPQRPGDDPEDHSLFIGVCSNYICDRRPGDEVKVTGPSGKRFLLPQNPADHDYLFVATGTGIAPFRGMAMEMLEGPGGPVESQIHLVMGSPYTSDLLYDDLFTRYAEEHDNFHYHVAISRERRPDGSRGIYVDKLVDEKLDELRQLLESPRTLIYICGLTGMQVGLYPLLARAGLADAYLEIGPALADVDPGEWTREHIKRHIRPTPRCMVEVY
ncbi:MAG: ferredoxin reductase domain-containing protein [Planctomycetota bacterium]|jgi:ferredoxin--NADP+ reductase